jgi:FKBP-type peptidyl-prolyl cis-trans isomerase SlyD
VLVVQYPSTSDLEAGMTDEMFVQDGQVVSMDYTLLVDGKVMDASEKGEPLEFIQGEGHIIPGLESAIYGMAVGDTKKVVVTAKEGYGELDDEAYVAVPKDQFPPNIPLEHGVELQVLNQDGGTLHARIEKIEDESVLLNFNHALAGKALHFEVKVVGLRQATDEEMSHGHVHQHAHMGSQD